HGWCVGALGLVVLGLEGADAVECVGGDTAAIAQAARELAVVDGAAAERRLRQSGLAAEIGDFPQNGVVHAMPPAFPGAPDRGLAPPHTPANVGQANQHARVWSTTKGPIAGMGHHWGKIPPILKRTFIEMSRIFLEAHSGRAPTCPSESGQMPNAPANRRSYAGRAASTARVIAPVPSRPPNSHGLTPCAKARSTASSMRRAASTAGA